MQLKEFSLISPVVESGVVFKEACTQGDGCQTKNTHLFCTQYRLKLNRTVLGREVSSFCLTRFWSPLQPSLLPDSGVTSPAYLCDSHQRLLSSYYFWHSYPRRSADYFIILQVDRAAWHRAKHQRVFQRTSDC